MQRKKNFLAFHEGFLALISSEKEQLKLVRLSHFTPDVKPLYMLRSLLEGEKYETITGLQTHEVLFRTLHLKLNTKREILAALPFQVEELLPYPAEETLLLPTFYPKKEGTEVSLIATSKATLNQHLTRVASFGVDPDRVSTAPVGLFRFVTHYYPKISSLIAFHLDTLIVIFEGRLVTWQSLKSGDLARVLAYTHKKFPDIDHFFSYGDEDLPLNYTRLEPLNPELENYTFAIGLAIDALKKDKQSCQFRFGKMLSKNQLERKKKNLFTYWSSCALFILVSLGMNHLYIEKREKAILHAIDAKEGVSLKGAISQLQGTLYRDHKKTLPISTIPKVHEVLTYLSTHPAISEGSISHLRYEILKMPRLGSQVKAYTAKVDLELNCENPSTARALHHALLHDQTLIDQKEEVRWHGDHGVYRASFHLKPQRLQ